MNYNLYLYTSIGYLYYKTTINDYFLYSTHTTIFKENKTSSVFF